VRLAQLDLRGLRVVQWDLRVLLEQTVTMALKVLPDLRVILVLLVLPVLAV
jgi:hypothetical protein